MAEDAITRMMTERDLQDNVIDAARKLGWRVAHFRPAQTAHGWRTAVSGDGVGFPDLVMVRGRRLIFAELKTEKGVLTAAQLGWMSDLSEVPDVYAYVWRPSDWFNDNILEALR